MEWKLDNGKTIQESYHFCEKSNIISVEDSIYTAWSIVEELYGFATMLYDVWVAANIIGGYMRRKFHGNKNYKIIYCNAANRMWKNGCGYVSWVSWTFLHTGYRLICI